MSRPSLPAVVSAALLAAACGGAGPWADRLDADPLNKQAKALHLAPTCRASVPIEFGRTFPLPVRAVEGPAFKLLYYPALREPSKYVVLTPAFEGSFPAGMGSAGNCRPLAASPSRELGDAVPPGLEGRRYYKAQVELYESLQKTAELYFRAGPAGPGGRETLLAFLKAFRTAAEPALLPDYYRLNPDFWEWLRKEAGESIPPA